MSSTLATAVGLLLYAAALLPPVIALRSHGRIMAFYTAFLVAIAAFHTGIFQRASLAPSDVIVRASASVDQTQCRRILDAAGEAGVRIDGTDPAGPRITGAGAEQLPAEVRDIILDCAARQSPANSTNEPRPSQ